MSNDPFAFIGSNANYQQPIMQNYQNAAEDYPTNYAPQMTLSNFNYHPPTQTIQQYPSARQVNYSHPEPTLPNPYQNGIPQANPQVAPTLKRHAFATFGPGGMIITSFPFVANRFEISNGKSVPRSLNLSKITISKVQVNTKVNDLFNGPLISSFTRRKASVLELLRDIRDKKCNQDSDYLWKLLITLVENDGLLVDEKNGPNNWLKIKKIIDYIPIVNSNSTAFETIQALLIQGNTVGACDYAQATNLWTHALIIASFIDSETYANTLNGFLEYEFTPGMKYHGKDVQEKEELTPLQVIYNLFSNAPNDSLLQILNSGQKWDWKVVLSIILANPTPNNLTAICSIGDELGKKDLMAAAHFCYLLCFTHSAVNELDLSRLFLVSSDHTNQPCFYKNYEAVQMTELLEYAKSLNGSSLPHFQTYKFAFAMEMADLGNTDMAAEYFVALQSILSDYKGLLGEKYKVLSEVVDEICDRHSVQFTNGASSGKKHAGWFTKGLDSLMSAAVGDTLENTDAKRKSRKYSRSNMDNSGSKIHSMASIDAAPVPEVDMTQQISMTSKSDSYSSYAGNSGDSYHADHFYAQSSGSQNYEASISNFGSNQHFDSSEYEKSRNASSLNSPVPPLYNNSFQNAYVGHQMINQRADPEKSYKNGNVASPNDPIKRNENYIKVPQVAQPYQNAYLTSTKNVGYYENTSQYMDHNIPPQPNNNYYSEEPSNVMTNREHIDEEKLKPVNLPPKSVPDQAIEAAFMKNNTQSNTLETVPEKAADKPNPVTNKNAPASKSLVDSLWGSLSIFGKSSKEDAAETPGPIKAKLGQELSCYFDDATGKWVFPDAPQTAEAAPLPPPPQTKAPPPTQNNSAATSRQPSPAPSGAASPAPLSSTPKPTYIGALGGSSRANRRTARSKYVDVLNPSAQSNDVQPAFDFTPGNNFGSAEPKIMTPNFSYSSYSGERASNNEKKPLENVSGSSKISQEPLNSNQSKPIVAPQIRPSAPVVNRPIPPNSSQRQSPNGAIQNGHPVRPAVMNRPLKPGVISSSGGRPGLNPGAVPSTNRSGYTRPINAPNAQPFTSNTAGKRMPSPNVRPAAARPYRPINPSSSKVPDDI